jgi:predicted MFS family arabinose efflux permease
MYKPYQMLLIPLTLWLGFSLAFIGADYTKSFVACAKGVDQIGFAMICFGVTDVVGSYAFGILHKQIGRKACFTIGALLNYITILIMINLNVRKQISG